MCHKRALITYTFKNQKRNLHVIQSPFSKQRSTATFLAKITNDDEAKLLSVRLGYSKAFGTIGQDVFMAKLWYYGIGGAIFN